MNLVVGSGQRAYRWVAAVLLAVLCIAGESRAAPTAADSMKAYTTLESWIRAWDVPTEQSVSDPAGTSAACVTLRLAGRVLGRATAVTGDGEAVRLAARGAIAEASERMPIERDALRRDRLLALAPSVEIDLQIAGQFVPIVADSIGEAALAVNPGRDGVAVRIGDDIEAVFPGVLLSTNMTPADGFVAALGALGLAPTAMNSAPAGDRKIVLLRFDTQHLAQTDAGRPPTFLTRGGRIVGVRDVSPASLAQLGDRVASYLISKAVIEEDSARLRGDYLPWKDAYEPEFAEPIENALGAYALARWANGSHGDAGVRDRAKSLAIRLIAPSVFENDATARGVAAASMRTIAGVAVENRPRADTRSNPPARGSSRAPEEEPLPAPVRAIRALALAEAARVQGHEDLTRAAVEDVRALFSETAPASMPGLMPWLGLAELALLEPGEPVPSAIALREFRAMVERGQVTLADAAPSGDEDFVGGVVFGVGDAALPTAHTLRPMVFLARMLGDDRLTNPEDRTAHLVRLLDALRFTRQLVADDAVCHMFPNREHALWGVRASLWDQRQPAEAAAMALLLILESLDAVDAIVHATKR